MMTTFVPYNRLMLWLVCGFASEQSTTTSTAARRKAERNVLKPGTMALFHFLVVSFLASTDAFSIGAARCSEKRSITALPATTKPQEYANEIAPNIPAATTQRRRRAPHNIRIRKTISSDLAPVARFLSTAATKKKEKQQHQWPLGFQARIDQIFAQSDIESLLRGRLVAIQEGQASWKRTRENLIRSSSTEDDTTRTFLRYWWSNNDRARHAIRQAALATAEHSVWRDHNFDLPPEQSQWLQHVQLTAVDNNDVVVGFCEVALLMRRHEQEWKDKNNYVAPVILNLAVAPSYRRRGVGHRLVSVAERYVQMHWHTKETPTMGLYVDPENAPARALYTLLGYEQQNDNGDDEFVFMTKLLGQQKK